MATGLDAAPWRPVHTRIAIALGLGWMLDAFEVQIIGSVIPGIQQEFHLDSRNAVWINVVWFVGIAVGALGFGYLADRVGRKRLFVATLILYSVAATSPWTCMTLAAGLASSSATGTASTQRCSMRSSPTPRSRSCSPASKCPG
jgi:MFS family permease